MVSDDQAQAPGEPAQTYGPEKPHGPEQPGEPEKPGGSEHPGERGEGDASAKYRSAGTVREVVREFTILGVTSFGGPVAHLGYFRERLVQRRQWISEQGYAELVALAQFLPGPASSQVGFALGMHRAGLLGGLAAFAAFTLPSAVLLVLAAFLAPQLNGVVGEGLIAGLKIVAVAVVAHAVWGMARTLTPDLRRIGIALAAGGLAFGVSAVGGAAWAPVVAIAVGAVAGLALCRSAAPLPAIAAGASGLRIPLSRRAGAACLVLVAVLLLALPVLALVAPSLPLALLDSVVRAGALAFGGGHVVLPLLESAVVGPGWVSESQFLAGYGAAQAVPGPLFTFAAFLGASMAPGGWGLLLATIALVGIFVPGLLLIAGVLPFWAALQSRRGVPALVRGASASVVGVLAAALIDPVATSAIVDVPTAILAALCVLSLMVLRLPVLAVVFIAALGGVLLQFL
jgi:chromate transporter